MFELTKDQDIVLGNESYNLACSLNFQAAPEEISCLALSKLLDTLGTDSVNCTLQIKEFFLKLLDKKSPKSFSYCSRPSRGRIEQFTTWARSRGPRSQIAFSLCKKKF